MVRCELLEMMIRPEMVDVVLTLIGKMGAELFSVSHVQGVGRQRGHTEIFRGREYSIETRPKVRVEVVVENAEQREFLVRRLRDVTYTGHIGDGKVFVFCGTKPHSASGDEGGNGSGTASGIRAIG